MNAPDFKDPKILKIVGITARDAIKRRIRENRISPRTNKSGGTTLVESKRLMNSINYRTENGQVIISTNVKYARIHHEGGTIVPNKAKFLAIPLTKAAKVMSPRDFKDTFIAKGCIMLKTGKGSKDFIPIYALKKKVKIPQQKYMFIDSNDKQLIINRIEEYWRMNYAN